MINNILYISDIMSINKQKILSYSFNNMFIKDKFTNLMMSGGNKRTSEKIILKLHKNLLKSKIKKFNVTDVLKSSCINSSPFVHVRSAKKGRKNFQLPYFFKHKNRTNFSYRILVKNSKTKYPQSMDNSLTLEILKSSTYKIKTLGKSFNVDKKLELYDAAQINKAFAHYRWF